MNLNQKRSLMNGVLIDRCRIFERHSCDGALTFAVFPVFESLRSLRPIGPNFYRTFRQEGLGRHFVYEVTDDLTTRRDGQRPLYIGKSLYVSNSLPVSNTLSASNSAHAFLTT
jgi:hypothetical protein